MRTGFIKGGRTVKRGWGQERDLLMTQFYQYQNLINTIQILLGIMVEMKLKGGQNFVSLHPLARDMDNAETWLRRI